MDQESRHEAGRAVPDLHDVRADVIRQPWDEDVLPAVDPSATRSHLVAQQSGEVS
jgi:hypothetical protein